MPAVRGVASDVNNQRTMTWSSGVSAAESRSGPGVLCPAVTTPTGATAADVTSSSAGGPAERILGSGRGWAARAAGSGQPAAAAGAGIPGKTGRGRPGLGADCS